MPHLGAAHDDQYYWITAKSLAEGAGYRTLSASGSPYHAYYPPLYPALLSMIWRLDPSFPKNLKLASLANWFLLPVFALVALVYFKSTELGWLAWPCAALIALLPIVIISAQRLMTELLFGSLLLLTLMALERAARSHAIRWTLVAGVLASAAYLTRTAGLMLILAGALALSFLYRRHLRAALFAVTSAPAVAAWTWWAHLHSSRGFGLTSGTFSNYADVFFSGLDWKTHITMGLKNASALTTAIPKLLVFGVPEYLYWALDIVLIVGAISLFRAAASRAYLVFAAAYIFALIAWPFPPDERLLMPLLPLLITALAILTRSAIHAISGRRKTHISQMAKGAAVSYLVIVGFALFLGAIGNYGAIGLGIPAFIDNERQQNLRDQTAWNWVRMNTPLDAGFVSDRPVVLYLSTGRRGDSPDLKTEDWYRSPEARTEDWLRSIPEYLRSNALQYALIRERNWTGLSNEQREAIREFWRQSGLVQKASPCEGCVVFETLGTQ